ncbi:bifunctional metallophosphatase/5'-nucleotidase [Bradyrhizobium sp.]|uniref:bifunctional metallophosphatase/5'-nucleotidase n=1 Tax=Bradyrhizobium sp. TaxID=376 RepID=UPI004037BEE1
MRSLLRSIIACATIALAAAPAHAQTAASIDLRILAINDFHGYLEPFAGGIRIDDPADRTKKIAVPAGGAEHMATLVKKLRGERRNSIFVAAGDLIGASPFLSALFHDEPTIEALSLMGLDVAAVGNHEFDEGEAELVRMQNGGCHPVDGCRGPHRFEGAKFRYLAASTIARGTGKPLFPPYAIREFDGVPVGFIGLTLKGTEGIVSPVGIANLEFRDEVETVNALIPELKARGAKAIVVLIHEGGFPTGDYDGCDGISGPIVEIVRKFDKAVDLVISGHTHRAYLCEIDGRLVTSADKYGTLVTAIDLKFDPETRNLVTMRGENHIVRSQAIAKNPVQTALIQTYEKLSTPIASRPAGAVTETLSRLPDKAGESVLGDIVTDAQLAATKAETRGGAVVAFTNPGGIRADIVKRDGGDVTFADVFAAQPFRNQLVTMTLTGRQIKDALEQQWADPKRPRILQVSSGFSFAWDGGKGHGERIIAERMTLNGARIDPAARYRVTVNNYLSVGGDGFTVFTEGTDQLTGVYDVDALFHYFLKHSPIGPASGGRIARID